MTTKSIVNMYFRRGTLAWHSLQNDITAAVAEERERVLAVFEEAVNDFAGSGLLVGDVKRLAAAIRGGVKG